MPEYEVVLMTPRYEVFTIQATSTKDAVAGVFEGKGSFRDAYSADKNETEFVSVEDLSPDDTD